MEDKRLISVADSDTLINFVKQQIGPRYKYIGVKYDSSPNVNPITGAVFYYKDSTEAMKYLAGLTYTRVITIPDATKLIATVQYETENAANNDGLCIWEGSHPDYTYASNYSTSISNRLYGSLNTQTFTIEGDTLTIAFKSDSSSNYYGYWLKVCGCATEEVEEDTIPWTDVMSVLTRPTTATIVTPKLDQLSTGYVSTIDLSNFGVDIDDVIVIGDVLTSTTSTTYQRHITGKPIFVMRNSESSYHNDGTTNVYWGNIYNYNPAASSFSMSSGPAQFYTYFDKANKTIRVVSQGGSAANKNENPFSGNVTIIA